jgi:hypothetical protein
MADDCRRHLRMRLEQSGVPESLHEGLVEYLVARRPTGSFLEAVLRNDLKDACARVDAVNRPFLYYLVFFLYNYAPGNAWGSPAAVEAWLTATDDPPLVFE